MSFGPAGVCQVKECRDTPPSGYRASKVFVELLLDIKVHKPIFGLSKMINQIAQKCPCRLQVGSLMSADASVTFHPAHAHGVDF